MIRSSAAGNHRAAMSDPTATAQEEAAIPEGFDIAAWAREACEATGVPFAVEDPVTLAKLRDLAEHPA